MMVRLDKESVVRLFCYCREAERSVHRALGDPWPEFQAYYGAEKVAPIRCLVGKLREALGDRNLSPLSSGRERPLGIGPGRFFLRYWFGRWLVRWEKCWSFSGRDICFIVTTLEALFRLFGTASKPHADALVALRMAFYDCERVIEGRCYGLREIERASRIDHFHSSPGFPWVQLPEILKDCA
jgi:hypothetical protein